VHQVRAERGDATSPGWCRGNERYSYFSNISSLEQLHRERVRDVIWRRDWNHRPRLHLRGRSVRFWAF
jgi:hypothetical protein